MPGFPEIAAALLGKQTICTDEAGVEAELDHLLAGRGLRIVAFVNAHAVRRAMADAEFFGDLMAANRLYRDGTGMGMLMQKVGMHPGVNMNGTDLIPRVLARAPRSATIALLGTTDARLDLAVQRLARDGFEDLRTANGFRPDDTYVDFVRAETPDIVILGMGMPKQERVARLLAADADLATRDMLVVNGGAILDYLSGDVPRAPDWMIRLGIEWAFRLARQPRRMFPRFIDSVSFALATRRHGEAVKTLLRQQ